MGDYEIGVIREKFRRAVLRLRAFERVLKTFEFATAYKKSDNASRHKLSEILKSENLPALKNWIDEHLKDELGLKSFRALRDMAKNENIPRWSRLSREELEEKLRKEEI